MGGRQLRCRFIRLLRRFISLLHSLRTFCRCRYQALFQRLSLFGLRLVFFLQLRQLLQFAYRLGGFGLLLFQRRLQAFLLLLCL
ncbi:hypothetical protein OSC18_23210 [Serratia nevei]|uniref:hypothetical protein n=1 Tax=Serratia nevei TaxID=2703794 RepID=UPI00285AAA72|nr:hypothetical protein [Serratia nevei]MDR8492401.1 hypothetical protein [Serratia nevei]